jgi:mono/diheme cytochrome c family protein
VLKVIINVAGALAGIAIAAAGGLYLYYFVILPRDLPVPDLSIELTPERVQRGKYLANAVYGCVYCHSERDWTLFGAPPKPGTIGQGGEVFDASVGVSGYLVSPNITPYHLGHWSDGEIYRAIVNGLHRDGYAFFPIMPFDVYLHLEDEEVYSIIAYLRTLEPILSDNGGEYTGRKLSTIMQFIANSRALPAEPIEIDEQDPVSRGGRMALIAGCRFCHTPANERMQPYEDMRFGGGFGMRANGELVYSSNISPDPATGIGNWTLDDFVQRFRQYAGARIPVSDTGFQTQHAWTEYAKLSDNDLAALFAYLMAQPPVNNEVTVWVEAPKK